MYFTSVSCVTEALYFLPLYYLPCYQTKTFNLGKDMGFLHRIISNLYNELQKILNLISILFPH